MGFPASAKQQDGNKNQADCDDDGIGTFRRTGF